MNQGGLDSGEIQKDVDLSAYSLESIKNTIYRFAARASIQITTVSESKVSLIFHFSPTQKPQMNETMGDFWVELNDQDLREKIRVETEPLRNIILAHAFSKTSLIND